MTDRFRFSINMEDDAQTTAQDSLRQQLSSLLAKFLRYAAYPIAGSIFVSVATMGTYFFFDRGKLQTQNELLQKRLEADENLIEIMKSQHSEQLRTLQSDLETLEKQLDAEREYAKNLQILHEKKMETLQILMAFGAKVPMPMREQFKSVMNQKIAQRWFEFP